MKRLRSTVLFAGSVGAYVFSFSVTPDASACDTVRMCVVWSGLTMEDLPFGDVAASTIIPARNARATIIRPYPEPAIGVFLDDEGCVEFDSQFRAGHKVKVFSEAVLGWSSLDYIQVKGFESVEDADADVDSFIPVDIVGIPASYNVQGEAPASLAEHVSHVVVAVEGLTTLQSRPGSPLSGAHRLEVVLTEGQQNGSAPSAQRISLGRIGFGEVEADNRSALRKKFIVMHEVGHWLQMQLGIGFPPIDYSYGPCPDGEGDFAANCELEEASLDPALGVTGNPYNEPCIFAVEGMVPMSFVNPNRHGIRSAEFAGGAAVEGYAHFVAAAALNTSMAADADGVWRYYKNADEGKLQSYQTFEENNRLVSPKGGSSTSTLGGQNAWVRSQCSDDWIPPAEFGGVLADVEISSEIDWFRFFWRFVTAPSASSRPTFWETVEYVAFVQGISGPTSLEAQRVWSAFEDGVLDPTSPAYGFSTRFYDLTDEHGLHNDGT